MKAQKGKEEREASFYSLEFLPFIENVTFLTETTP